ncbi:MULTISPECIES: plastocyanin/azurin family copper-binding protein [unclassified Haladaptatus]|uniref:plastocyanin/azurin family copper-binding protein n=1 Tax=unclassified Haladaptatus TaxID=2622732 RepID=UPI0023E7FEEB|nr:MULTISPECIES: plastocyanin/azurin family copper-binding protein [unclassified Haladaptatus]
MKRRDFLLTASGVAGGTAVVGAAPAVAQEEPTSSNNSSSGEGTTTPGAGNNSTDGGSGGGGGGGGSKTVTVGPGGDLVFTPGTDEPLYASPGTTVTFVWESDNHNIVVDSQPDGANWGGHEPLENSGFEYEHTFETTGTYAYHCQPHQASGMVGEIIVNESGAPPTGGEVEIDAEEMGVPIQAHFVGIATILMLVVSLIYTFFLLKYGESPHAKGGN